VLIQHAQEYGADGLVSMRLGEKRAVLITSPVVAKTILVKAVACKP
jgi:hypothetical protein